MNLAAQPDLFNAMFNEVAAARLRDKGIDHATKGKNALLTYAREGAREIALSRVDRTCTADDVQRWLVGKGFDESVLQNATGGLFREKCWKWDGSTVMSKRTAAHRRLLRVWTYVGK